MSESVPVHAIVPRLIITVLFGKVRIRLSVVPYNRIPSSYSQKQQRFHGRESYSPCPLCQIFPGRYLKVGNTAIIAPITLLPPPQRLVLGPADLAGARIHVAFKLGRRATEDATLVGIRVRLFILLLVLLLLLLLCLWGSRRCVAGR